MQTYRLIILILNMFFLTTSLFYCMDSGYFNRAPESRKRLRDGDDERRAREVLKRQDACFFEPNNTFRLLDIDDSDDSGYESGDDACSENLYDSELAKSLQLLGEVPLNVSTKIDFFKVATSQVGNIIDLLAGRLDLAPNVLQVKADELKIDDNQIRPIQNLKLMPEKTPDDVLYKNAIKILQSYCVGRSIYVQRNNESHLHSPLSIVSTRGMTFSLYPGYFALCKSDNPEDRLKARLELYKSAQHFLQDDPYMITAIEDIMAQKQKHVSEDNMREALSLLNMYKLLSARLVAARLYADKEEFRRLLVKEHKDCQSVDFLQELDNSLKE